MTGVQTCALPIYKLSIKADFNSLLQPVGFEKAIVSYDILPPLSNHLGRSYNIEKNLNNELFLVVVDVEIVIIKGDVSENDLVTVTDLVMLRRYLAGSVVLGSKGILAADINMDGRITTTDLVLLRRLLSEME